MPWREDDADEIYADLILGRRRAIGWGATSSLPYYLEFQPFPIERIVDVAPRMWGGAIRGVPVVPPDGARDLDPASTVVVVFPFYDEGPRAEIVRAVERFGDFVTVPPYRHFVSGPTLSRRLAAEAASDPRVVRFQAAFDLFRDPERQFALLADWNRRADAELGPAVRRRARPMTIRIQPGGAERQVTYLAAGLGRAGWDTELVCFLPSSPGAEHYETHLADAGVPLRIAPTAREFYYPDARPGPLPAELERVRAAFSFLPLEIAHSFATAYHHLARTRPELVVCYLDSPNIPVGLAAAAAGVPRIVLSGRNLHPGNFPNHYGGAMEWLERYYKMLIRLDSVVLSANSEAGSRSYEEWLGLPRGGVRTIRNGVPPEMFEPPPVDEVAEIRATAGAGPDAPLVVGVFRLAEEKNPLSFIRTLAGARRRIPGLRGLIVGTGPLEAPARDLIAELDLACVLVGSRRNARSYLAAADLVLHTARAEGHPNVIMEAQILAKPIVCTDAGGTRECLCPDLWSGMLPLDDADGLVEALVAALADLPAARARAARAPEHIRSRFGLDRLVRETSGGN